MLGFFRCAGADLRSTVVSVLLFYYSPQLRVYIGPSESKMIRMLPFSFTRRLHYTKESSRKTSFFFFTPSKLSFVLDLVALKVGNFILQRGGDLLQSEGQLFALGGRIFLQRQDDLRRNG